MIKLLFEVYFSFFLSLYIIIRPFHWKVKKSFVKVKPRIIKVHWTQFVAKLEVFPVLSGYMYKISISIFLLLGTKL